MNSTYRSVEALLACRLLTQDGAEAGLTDLILDTEGDAPTGPLPVAGGGETSVHIMTPKG